MTSVIRQLRVKWRKHKPWTEFKNKSDGNNTVVTTTFLTLYLTKDAVGARLLAEHGRRRGATKPR